MSVSDNSSQPLKYSEVIILLERLAVNLNEKSVGFFSSKRVLSYDDAVWVQFEADTSTKGAEKNRKMRFL
jgi:hypothetical protein